MKLSLSILFVIFSIPTITQAQSKKELIAILANKVDSLNRELINQNTMNDIKFYGLVEKHKEEVKSWSEKEDEMKKKIHDYEGQINLLNEKLKHEISSSKKKDGEINNLQLSVQRLSDEKEELAAELLRNRDFDQGILLQADKENEFGMDVIEKFVSTRSVTLPTPQDLLRDRHFIEIVSVIDPEKPKMFDYVKPVGWTKEGLFAYYEELGGPCGGPCSLTLNVMDLKKNKSVYRKEYSSGLWSDLSIEQTESKEIVSELTTDLDEITHNFGLILISSLKMYFKSIHTSNIEFDQFNVELQVTDTKAFLKKTNKLGIEIASYEIKLETQEWDGVCLDKVLVNGYFHNPMNQNQVVMHLLRVNGCGFEGELDHKNTFMLVN
jgi:hypothetical protein